MTGARHDRRRPARAGAELRIAVAAVILAAGLATPAFAAPPAPTTQPDAAKPDSLKPTFDALPEEQRRALQDALLWTGDFTGNVSGSYGPRTRDALVSDARRVGIPVTAALDPPNRTRLMAAAETARRAVGFATLRDPRAGVAIGLPLKLLPNRSDLPSGTRYSAADGAIVADTLAKADASPVDLADMFDRLTRDAPGRRVTYRLAKPDFIVVSGEAGDRKFYARYVLGSPPGEPPAIRGFAMSYPKAVDNFDAVTLAVAASLDPFPAPETAPKPPPRPGPAAAPVVATAPIPPPPAPVVAGQAVLVGPGVALTRLAASRCAGVGVDGAPARWIRQDPMTGLALLELGAHREVASIALTDAGADASLTALFLVGAGGGVDQRPTLAIATASRPADDPTHVIAPLQGPGAGVVVVDGRGALAGLVGDRESAPVQVGGITLEARYSLLDAAGIASFLRDANVSVASPVSGSVAPGAAAAAWKARIVPVTCTPNS